MSDSLSAPKLSIIVCTYNRSALLNKCLQSLVGQSCPPTDYEIIVVDNGSVDNTADLVNTTYASYAHVHYIFEPLAGLSQARNSGCSAARGKYLAFIDDDAQAGAGWALAIVNFFESETPVPRVGLIGGRTLPDWEIKPPKWLITAPHLYKFLSVRDGGLNGGPCSVDDVWGVNMAYLRKALEECKGFDTRLGRSGNNLLSCEETLLNKRIAQAGYSAYYVPDMLVTHFIPASRLTRRWFFKRFFFQGVSMAQMERLCETADQSQALGFKHIIRSMAEYFPSVYSYILGVAGIAGKFYGKWLFRDQAKDFD